MNKNCGVCQYLQFKENCRCKIHIKLNYLWNRSTDTETAVHEPRCLTNVHGNESLYWYYKLINLSKRCTIPLTFFCAVQKLTPRIKRLVRRSDILRHTLYLCVVICCYLLFIFDFLLSHGRFKHSQMYGT